MTVENKTLFTILTPEKGKHLKDKNTGDIYEYQLFLGKNDSIDNYEEVDEQTYQDFLNREIKE